MPDRIGQAVAARANGRRTANAPTGLVWRTRRGRSRRLRLPDTGQDLHTPAPRHSARWKGRPHLMVEGFAAGHWPLACACPLLGQDFLAPAYAAEDFTRGHSRRCCLPVSDGQVFLPPPFGGGLCRGLLAVGFRLPVRVRSSLPPPTAAEDFAPDPFWVCAFA